MDEIPTELITTYLQMTSPAQFRPAFSARSDLLMLPMETIDLAYYRFLYGSVGEMWRWRDRLIMPDAQLMQILSAPSIRVSVLYAGGVPAGYVELDDRDGDVELAYFGLRPAFIGQGLGKHLLSYGIQQAWETKPKCTRVWVHTCNLDSPHALANYQARGFMAYDVIEAPMPDLYR
jgi:GNAT superfamily N-acetyltransferase